MKKILILVILAIGTVCTATDISNMTQLQAISRTGTYTLINDIDATGFDFTPLLSSSTGGGFVGTLDGNGYVIRNLTVNTPATSYIGLFKRLETGAVVKNIGLVNVNLTGNAYVGSLSGWMSGGTITDCYTTGTNTAAIAGSAYVAGFLGSMSGGTVTRCYSLCSVTSSNRAYTAGFVGYASGGTLADCYSAGAVNATATNVGGFVGKAGATITNCFWDTTTSLQATSAGAETGLTTAQMKNPLSMVTAGWSFVDNWIVSGISNSGYPRLTVFVETAPQRINGIITSSRTSAAKINGVIYGGAIRENKLVSYPIKNASLIATYCPVTYDKSRGRVLAFSGSMAYSGSRDSIYYTTDGTTWTKLGSVADGDFVCADDYVANGIRSLTCLDDGTYLACIGNSTDTNPETTDTKPFSKIFRNTTGEHGGWVETTWTQKPDSSANPEYYNGANPALPKQGLVSGVVDQMCWTGIDGQYIVIGEYGSKTDEDPSTYMSPKNVYISSNGGANWQWIYAISHADSQHIHCATWQPLSNHTKVWISVGDGVVISDIARMERLDYSDGAWTLGETLKRYGYKQLQPVFAMAVGGSIYWGSDSGMPTVMRHDTTTNYLYPSLQIPAEATNYYKDLGDSSYCFDVQKINDIYYANVSDNLGDNASAGLWISKDLVSWIPFYRFNYTTEGARYFTSGIIGDTLYLSGGKNLVSTHNGFKCDVPIVENMVVTKTMPAITNYLSATNDDEFDYADAATFISNYTLGANLSAERITTDKLYGSYSIKLTVDGAANSLTFPSLSDVYSASLETGDIVTAVCWVKSKTYSWDDTFNFDNTTAEPDGLTVYNYTASVLNFWSNNWERASITYVITNGDTVDKATILPVIKLGGTTGDYYLGNAAYYVQKGTNALNFSGNANYISDTISEDYGTVDLSKIGSEFTAVFSWLPSFATEQADNTGAIEPICELSGVTGTVDLYWSDADHLSLKSDLEAAVSSSETYRPYFGDIVWIAIRGKVGEYTQAIIFDPINMATTGTYTLGDGGSQGVSGTLLSLILGKNSGGEVSPSGFSNVSIYNKAMSRSEIINLFHQSAKPQRLGRGGWLHSKR